MFEPTQAQLRFMAQQHFDAGRFEETRGLCQKILTSEPNCSQSLQLLGLMLEHAGHLESAVDFLQRARNENSQDRVLLKNLARILYRAGHQQNALAACRELMAINPSDGEIQQMLADLLHQAHEYEQAVEHYERLLNQQSPRSDLLLHLGDCLYALKRYEDSLRAYQRIFEMESASAAVYIQMTRPLLALGKNDEALAAGVAALRLEPLNAELAAKLDESLLEKAMLKIAIVDHQKKALENPDDPSILFQLGVAMQRRDMFDDAAVHVYRRVLALCPGHLGALNNLGVILGNTDQLGECLDLFRQAVDQHPFVPACHSNLLYTLHFHAQTDAAMLHREHQRWAERHAHPLKSRILPHRNDRSPGRRLRIGYVSPNFHAHPIGRFLRGFFPAHNHEQFEIVCYSSTKKSDCVTADLRNCADRWVEARHMSDEELAEQIRADGIDILVDVTMHMSENRMLVFARKPAPIQMTYLAYCSTTGLDCIDYRLTDFYLDPPGAGCDEPFYFERSLHLPRSYWCYDPGIATPAVNALPSLERGCVTFASLNNFSKVSTATLELWLRLLQSVEHSRLLIHSVAGSHRQRVWDYFETHGIARDRVEFFGLLPLPEYFELLKQVDIALDPFPYPGGTTTCDALWMGVPTISLVGDLAYTRSGLSILSNVGLPELATTSTEKYFQQALALARDSSRLAMLRATLRSRMQSSPLMDAPRFAGDLEAIYRSAWEKWCASRDEATSLSF